MGGDVDCLIARIFLLSSFGFSSKNNFIEISLFVVLESESWID